MLEGMTSLFDGTIERFYFAQPWAFILLALLPVYFILWRNHQKQQLDQALDFSLTAAVKQASLKARINPWQSLMAMMVVLLVLIAIVAKPTVIRKVPDRTVDMMLVMDISISMKAKDIAPSRIDSAREAAKAFVSSLPGDVRLGLVLFAGQSHLVASPSTNHRQINRYLSSLTQDDLQTGTAIGDAVQTALEALKVDALSSNNNAHSQTKPSTDSQKVIVLMTDGDQQIGYPWQQAASNAKKQQASIFTVGVGSQQGATIQYHDEMFFVSLNESVLKNMSEITGGQYYRAFSEKDFKSIYDSVREHSVHWVEVQDDLGFILALLLLMLGLCRFSLLKRLMA